MAIENLSRVLVKDRIVGKANQELTPEVATVLGGIHGTYLNNTGIIVIGRDYRLDSRMLKRAYTSGAMSTGIDLLDLHAAPLPLLQFCVRRFGASGGVYFSSGHSLKGDTGIRFFDSGGIEYSHDDVVALADMYDHPRNIKRVDPPDVGQLSPIPHTVDIYSKALPQFIDRKKVASANLKVVVDCSYGPTGEIAPALLGMVNVDVIALNTFIQRSKMAVFPNLKSIRAVANIVTAAGADLGVVFDVDGSRGIIFDETGNVINFEDLAMLFISRDEGLQKAKSNPVITTQSSSKIIDEFCSVEKFDVVRTDNTPGNISRKIREERACFGASDTQKFYFPSYGPFADGTFTLLKLLDILADNGEPLSVLCRSLPKTIQSRKMLTIDRDLAENIHQFILDKIHQQQLEYIDDLLGIKVILGPGKWVSISPALHRDALELVAEAPDPRNNEELIEFAENLVGV
ncbi:MAG: hypothetical protein ACTSU5_06505 [Promethearchaeota archaeon]